MPRTAAALVVAIIAAGCSTSPPPSAEPHAGHTTGVSPSASAGEPHAGHSAGDSGASGTPHPSAPEGADGTIVLPDEIAMGGAGVSVAEALEAASSQPVLVNGILLRDAEGGIWFCERLDDARASGLRSPGSVGDELPARRVGLRARKRPWRGFADRGRRHLDPNQQLFGVVHPAP